MITGMGRLLATVQHNCNVADARHARDMTMCNYLLEMREFFRWEQDIAADAPLDNAAVGAWLSEREALWETLADDDYVAIPVGDDCCEPFAAADISRRLLPHGLVYGAGVGRFGKAHFFLGEVARHEVVDNIEVTVCECEYARDLNALPAASRDGALVVRREALRQWLWQKMVAWGGRRRPGALALALAAHGYADNQQEALARMVEVETESLILHECGECAAGRLLGAAWREKIAACGSRRAEILLRAVRDNLADCLVTLPQLIERQAWSSLWFWFANLEGMRRELFPAFAAFDGAALEALAHGGAVAAAQIARRGETHWLQQARLLLAADAETLQSLAHDASSLALK